MRWLGWVQGTTHPVWVWLAMVGFGLGAGASTLGRVRTAKAVVCGVNTEVGDYSRSDDHGARGEFDRDLCRAVAVAILGVGAKVVVKEFPDDSTGMEALLAGKVDLLPTLTVDFSHSTGTGVRFSRVMLWDGVGFLVPVASGVKRGEELAGKKVCLLDGTEVEESVGAWFRRKGLAYDPFPFQEEGEMEAALVTGGCAAIAGDQTRLAMTRVGFGAIAGRFRVLGEMISMDPLAAAYAKKDEDEDEDEDGRFGEIVDWVMEALVVAEERGVTAALAKKPDGAAEWDMTVRRLAGTTHELGARLGLADDWAAQVVGVVGNYGEIFARDLGVGSATGMERGWNRLGRAGGLMVGLPLK